MDGELISALVGLLGSGLGALAGSRLTQYRIVQLEKKVDKHNCLIERMYRVEEGEALIEEKLKVANHRIEHLEQKIGRREDT